MAKKRAFPDKYAATRVHTPSGVDPVKRNAHEIFQQRERSSSTFKTIPGRNDTMLPDPDNTWMQEVPPTRNTTPIELTDKTGKAFTQHLPVPTPRKAAQQRRREENAPKEMWSSREGNARFAGYTDWNFFVVTKEPDVLKLYFNAGRWIFVREITETFIQYSRVYNSKPDAMSAYRRGKIFWSGDRRFKEGVWK